MKPVSADIAVMTPRKSDELEFQPSPQASLGVEVELQLLDRETGDLSPGAPRVLNACAEESICGTSEELMQSMLEIKTGICRNVAEAQGELVATLARVRNISRSMGFELAIAGTHPFHRTTGSVLSPGERYERINDRLAWMVHQRVVFGLHVHVGMPDGDMAIGVINMLVQYLPHLLAVTANSPFWQGIDTGLASCRTALYRSLPHAGVPRYFPKWKDFRTFARTMRDCGAIQSPKDIYWDIRPRPDLGTIEFRVCDMPPTLSNTLAAVALIRALVISTQRLLEERPQLRRGDMRRHWIAVENKWLATRYGLEAMYIRTPGGKRRPLRSCVADLVERLMPIARESGDDSYLAGLLPLQQFETGAARQRRIYRETGSWHSLIDDMIGRLSAEVDALSARTQERSGPLLTDVPAPEPTEPHVGSIPTRWPGSVSV